MMSRDEYWRAWSAVHQDIDPSSSLWIRGYLCVVYPIARGAHNLRITPNVVTASGIGVSAALMWSATQSSPWLLMMLMLLGIATDAIDGALAIGQNKTTLFGGVFDSVVDRINEAALVIALLIVAGFDFIGVAMLAFTLVLIMEYMRARAHAALSSVTELITVWERPTRVIVSIAAVIAGMFTETFLNFSLQKVSIIALSVWIALGIAGNVQLVRHLYRHLAA